MALLFAKDARDLSLRLLNIPPAVDTASDQKLDGEKAWEWQLFQQDEKIVQLSLLILHLTKNNNLIAKIM